MRGNHGRMIEFVDAFEKDGHFFAVVELQSRRFQFGVSKIGYRALRQAMQVRPFDMMSGRKYRYFYFGSQKTAGTEKYWMEVRVELDKDATKDRIDIPKDLHANLLWLARLENLSDAAYLEIKNEHNE
ncbi:MAG TPA: hypothetical protein VL572_03850 [Pyrinomonadaceae bacterium]|jgi:hypothetical protein|nr:hypothetical protein [Pyrinomonadaceae bacterium]